MKISSNNLHTNINFRAHYYKVEPKTQQFSIQIDEKPDFGIAPYLVYQNSDNEIEEIEMEQDGSRYSSAIYLGYIKPNASIKYHIQYADTGTLDKKDGKDYSIFPYKIQQKALIQTRKQHNQPMIHALNSGKTVGKILFKDRFSVTDSLDYINEPTIIVTDTFHSILRNPNIVGLIFTTFDSGALSHMSTQFRNNTDVCGSVFEPKLIEQLKQYNGKNVEIELSDDNLMVNITNKTGTAKKFPQITIPHQKPIDKILQSNEYSTDFVGAKALNLRKLEELAQTNKIDAIVPKSIALPHAWIQHLFDENIGQQQEYERNKKYYQTKEQAHAEYEKHFEEKMKFLIETMKKNGLNTNAEYVIVRSSFNGEDLSNYSAAGLYDSGIAQITPQSLYEKIIEVAQSKWSEDAIYSRQQQNIPSEEIKPTVIIQDYIKPEYKFTLYTDFNNSNKIRIEMYSDEMVDATEVVQPHVFEYDKQTQELTYKSIQMGYPTVEFDENLNILELDEAKYDLISRPYIFTLLYKLVENAIAIEKEFGHPQDIEGGFLTDKIYLWQTRNIVN